MKNNGASAARRWHMWCGIFRGVNARHSWLRQTVEHVACCCVAQQARRAKNRRRVTTSAWRRMTITSAGSMAHLSRSLCAHSSARTHLAPPRARAHHITLGAGNHHWRSIALSRRVHRVVAHRRSSDAPCACCMRSGARSKQHRGRQQFNVALVAANKHGAQRAFFNKFMANGALARIV